MILTKRDDFSVKPLKQLERAMPLRCLRHQLACLTLILGFCTTVQANEVSLVGSFPGKAILSINGSPPKILAVGQSHDGVKVLSVDQDSANVEIAGKTHRLRLGDQPYRNNASTTDQDERGEQMVVLTADPSGHFLTQGKINGNSTRFLVDTGASAVAISAQTALRLGIKLDGAPRMRSATANGMVGGWVVKLDHVSVGNIKLYGIDAMVLESEMPVVLLGMTFLNRVKMTHEGNTMTLKKRY